MSPRLLRNALFLIWLGSFLLLINLDRLSWSFFWWVALTFWPLLLIAWGWERIFSSQNLRQVAYLSTLILMGPLAYVLFTAARYGSSRESSYQYQLEKKPEWNKLELNLKLRSNDLYVSSDPNYFVSGDFDYLLARPDVSTDEEAGRLELAISDRDWFWPLGRWRVFRDRDWEVSVSESIPTALSIRTGRGDVQLDTRFLQLEKLSVAGASDDVSIRLAPKAKDLTVELSLPRADLEISLPDSVGVEASGKIDWGNLNGFGRRFAQKDKSFFSENYDKAQQKVHLRFAREPESLDLRAE
ncbi:MAG: hypothetical protein L0196_11695 [candidate division Zixibacteria bacterium]|nr:hypothetical protein [candidate division Zixibacteria bacterium]